MKIVLRVAGPLVIAIGSFLLCTRDGIAPMAAQFSDGRLRRRRRSRRYQPCLVRMAVSARAHLGSRRANPRSGTVTRGFNGVSIHQDYFRTSMVGSEAWAW
jgi:hypothetical protein